MGMPSWWDRVDTRNFFRLSTLLLVCAPLFLPQQLCASGGSFPSAATSASSPARRRAQVSGQKGREQSKTVVVTAKNQNRQPAAAGGEGMGAKAVGNLPLNGRSASQVAALVPGVVKARTQGKNSGSQGYGTQLVIYGGRPRQNDYRLDGISVVDYANGPMGNAIGITLGVDAIQRLTVLTSNDQAEFGRSNGGYISSTTRSGTNLFHGSVFEYIRNSALDARNFFDAAKPPFRRNQFGATFGGPIWKDRVFFFGDYEGIRQSQGISNVAVVPSLAARQGNLSTGPVTVDPAIKRVLDAFYPLPNAGLLGSGDEGIYLSSGQQITPGNHVTTRVDDKFSRNDSLYAVYMFDKGSVTTPDKLSSLMTGYDSLEHFLALGETHNFSPELVNTFRFGIYRMVANSGPTSLLNNPAMADASYGAVPGQNLPAITVPGLVKLIGGIGGSDIYHFRWTSIQAYDDVSLTKGKHSLKFGASVERMRDNILAIKAPSGLFTFNSLADFLTNQPFSITVAIPGGARERGFRQTIAGAYAQDNWLFQPNLTLDLGLRYEMATVPGEVNGYVSSLRNLTDPQPEVGEPLFSNPTLRNFEPRVGFAWDPFGTGKTVVRSGFGFFDVLPLLYEIQFGEMFSAPFMLLSNVTNLPAGSYPTEAFQLAQSSPAALRQGYFEPHPRRNYVMQWNLNVQRVLPLGFQMQLGYVGSRGVHNIFRVTDADMVLPTLTSQGYLWPSPAGSGTRLNPNAGTINASFWEGDSYYDALVLQVQSPVGHRFQATGSYTFGKSIDTSSGSIGGGEYSNAITNPLWFDTRLNRGLSDFNIAQDLKVIYSWGLPSPHLASNILSWPLSGWQLGGVFEASSGLPFTPGFGGDPLGVLGTDSNVDVPNVLRGPGCDSLVNPGNPNNYIRTQCLSAPNPITLRGNLGRNALIGPGLMNLDFSIFKNNDVKIISESVHVQFRAEIFNIFNRANFDPPIYFKNVFDSNGNPIPSGGFIDKTQDPSRQIQFALRISF
jgi:outer membrane receptor protein involved in Fe transport